MSKSQSLTTIIPELGNAAIRRTPEGHCSVYDLITVVGGQKDPYNVWKRLCKEYSEVLTKCQDFKFSGRGQRETPVTDKEGWAFILGLLPGVMGKKYREGAANLVLRYLDGDVKLAAEIADRNDSQEDLEWLEARVRGKLTRKRFTGVLKARNVRGRGYAICTNKTYLGLFGGTAKQLKANKGLRKNDNLRDHLAIGELNQTAFTEDLSGKRINKVEADGNNGCASECLFVAQKVADFSRNILNA
ncbi:hypothetical protein [Leptothoe spongobia]|uniref:Uncharacterized protein n=1 Tax=Leptothoe spongobia TAU-MAC 1115 TaxID=1967444 RepID=A0A947DBG3_9CYAN|nr:hypothetical protein [Leptothoe spongobia]MBT9314131.1 hypothetical protein [Leptothoe spongobia TAU-MAC 1115]